MNFLEGLRRLFLIFSVLVVGGIAIMGWSDAAPPYWCNDPVVAANPFDKFDPPKDMSVCPTQGRDIAVRSFRAAAFGAIAAVALLVMWLVMRWIITGFFPATARKT